MAEQKVITRFAPSPTGLVHIGNVRSAIFSYLFAKHYGGSFLLRIEDTDKERDKPEYTEDILSGLAWLGLQWDNNPPVKQSERGQIYKKYLDTLVNAGLAYLSKEEPKKEGERSEVIRLRNPGKEVVFNDLVRGEVRFNTAELGDIVIAKSMEEPIFHLANVIDDYEMGVTHIIRGEDHISNTPRQILIREALDLPNPLYAHLPLVLAADHSKLSKRHGATSLREFIDLGYRPEALFNYMALLGWHPENEDEIFTKDELIERFDLARVQKGGAIWDSDKLDWINKQHLLKIDPKHLSHGFKKELIRYGIDESKFPDSIMARLEPVILERINKLSDINVLLEKGELQYFFDQPAWKKESFLWKGQGDFKDVIDKLAVVEQKMAKVPDGFDKDSVKEAIWPYAEEVGRGLVLWPLRYALSGLEKSADPFTIAGVLGRQKTIERLKNAIEYLSNGK